MAKNLFAEEVASESGRNLFADDEGGGYVRSLIPDDESLPALPGSALEQQRERLRAERAEAAEVQPQQDERDLARLGDPGYESRQNPISDTLKTMASGATTGTIGFMGGTLEGILKNIASGKYGTQEGADMVEKLAMQRMGEFTREPKTEKGKEHLKSVGEFLEPVGSLPPFLPGAQQLQGASRATIQKAASDLDRVTFPSITKSEKGFKSNDLSVGAAQTGKALERDTTARNMPIPFEGDSALTQGQKTRNFEQLQFEKETAKKGDIGEPLRERVENQTSTLISNLDALSDQAGGVQTELRDIGMSIDGALIGRFEKQKKIIDKLYEEAREAGQMRAPVEIDRIGLVLDDISKFEDLSGVGGLVKGANAYARKNGIIDDNGNPRSVSLEDAELFRQWINDATDLTDSRQARIRRVLISAIDDATEQAGGDIYQSARKARAAMAREFENVGITKRLLSTKRGTDERSIAYEDAFKKVLIDSPIEEINKLRGTLLKSGDKGKQAWSDIKSKGIQYIKESSLSASQRDSKGNPLLSPDKLNRVIKSLDQGGKLDSIYGKRNAQIIRDLGDIANDIYTAPPGAINHSNTASAMSMVLDTVLSGSLAGINAPMATAIKEAAKYTRDRKVRKRIRAALGEED